LVQKFEDSLQQLSKKPMKRLIFKLIGNISLILLFLIHLSFSWNAITLLKNKKRGHSVVYSIRMEDGPEQLAPLINSGSISSQKLDVKPFFEALSTSDGFIHEYWQKKPFKVSSIFENMVQGFTMKDVAKEVEGGFLEAGRGTFIEGRTGWQMAAVGKPRGKTFEEAKMRVEDVEKALSERSGTVVFNSAGATIKTLAQVCRDTGEAMRLPVALNLYVTAAGQKTSAPPHTDKQDVFVFQTQGKKGWKVYAPPNPAEKLKVDPFQRGKGTDMLDLSTCGAPLIETVLQPGQVLYVPAGFPHTTDTVTDNDPGDDPSVHLTIGIDTHIWGLTFAHLREFALKKAGIRDKIDIQRLDARLYWNLQSSLPLGFLDNGAFERHKRYSETKAAIISDVVTRAIPLIRQCEPDRWADLNDQQLEEKLQLQSVSNRLIEHYEKICGLFNEMYDDTIHELTEVPMGLSVFRVKPYLEQLDQAMETLLKEYKVSAKIAPAQTIVADKGIKKGFGGSKIKRGQ